MDSPDLSPGSSPWDTNRTNRLGPLEENMNPLIFWYQPLQLRKLKGRECLLEFIKNEKLIISICTAGDDFYRQLLRRVYKALMLN